MKKFFKRFLSSVLATVMTVSVLSIGMATNVFADNITGITLADSINASDLTAGDIKENTDYGKFTLIADSSNYFTVDENTKKANDLSITKRLKTNGSSSITKRAIKFTTTEANTTLYVWAMSSKSTEDRTLNVWNSNSTVVGTIAAPGAVTDSIIPGGSLVLETAGDYYVGSSGSGINIYLLGTDKALAGSTSEATTYTWTLDTSRLTIGIDTDKLGFAADKTTATTNTLTYSGTDYQIVSGMETVTGTPDDNDQITVVPEDSWFTEITTPEPADGTITDKDLYIATSKMSQVSSGETAKLDDYITALEGVTGAEPKTTIAGYYYITYGVKLNGKTSLGDDNLPTKRAIKFATSDAGSIQFIAGGNEGTLTIYASNGTVVKSVDVAEAYGLTEKVTLPNADTYYVASTDNNITLALISIIVGDGVTSVTNGSVLAESNDAYIIASVSTSEVGNNDTIAIKVGDQTSEADNYVYKAAKIDGHYYTAEELGADYIYVVKAVNAVKNAALDTVKAFEKVFTTVDE